MSGSYLIIGKENIAVWSMYDYRVPIFEFPHTLFSDLRLLAISTNITELSYTISDIQTRIFGMLYNLLSHQLLILLYFRV